MSSEMNTAEKDGAPAATPVSSAANEGDRTAVTATTRRRRWLGAAIGSFALMGAAYGAYWIEVSRYTEATDDAYVDGNVVLITPQVSGTVVEIHADDTQFVDAGQPLVRLDSADAKVALARADAGLASAVRDVRNLIDTTTELHAQVEVRRTQLAIAQQDLLRRELLGRSGAISAEELQHARDAARSAHAALLAAEAHLAANRARIEGTTLETHPEVRSAAAAVRGAYLDYGRTMLPAPVSGFVAKRNVQLGERVGPGMALMAVVPLSQVWVDANFKEPQLAHMRVGQSVVLTADMYGNGVRYHGRVVGFGAGTGSAFALLPAQNATGNWIKIVQRVPARIALDPRELAAHPLEVGLSMKAVVNVRDGGGQRLPRVAIASPRYATGVYDANGEAADAHVESIIAANEPQGRLPKVKHDLLAGGAPSVAPVTDANGF